ncbi:MAG: TonB-dependent receptor [Lentisphaeraceae bacterium]|nr:TonB-dependent receptor [Lentisphaeraceae bacterium]
MNVLSSFRKRRLTFIAAIALGLPLTSMAQEEPTKEEIKKEQVANTKEKEEVVILGEKMGRSAQETTSSVQVFSQDNIKKSSSQSGYDFLRKTANVQVANQNNITIRGIGATGEAGDARAINTYVDGVILQGNAQRRGVLSNIWDIQQIEIYRGPQSTTQGRDSIGGAIRVKTNDPTYDWTGAMRLGVGEYDTLQQAIAFGGPIIDDTLAFRVAYDDQSTDGTISNTMADSDRSDRTYSRNFRAKLLWDATEDLSFLLTYSNIQTLSGYPHVDAADPFARKQSDVAALFQGPRVLEMNSFSLEANYDIDENWFFTSHTTSSKQEYVTPSAITGPLVQGLVSGTPQGVRELLEEHDRAITQEFRLNYTGDDLRALIGLYLSRTDTSGKREVPGLAPVAGPSAGHGVNTESRDVENMALFAELDYDVNDDWTLNLGARGVYEKVVSGISNAEFKALENVLKGASLIGPTETIGTSVSDSQSEYVFLPKIGLTYHAADNVDVSATVQRGYRAGGLSTPANLFGTVSGTLPYDPEYSWNYELALRSHWFDSQLIVNANVFYMDYEDQQVNEMTEIPNTNISLGTTVNAGKSHSYGAELELVYTPKQIEGLQAYANLGLLKTEFDEYNTSSGDFTGNEFGRSPEISAAAGVSYFHKSGLFGNIEARYNGEAFTSSENVYVNDAHLIFDGKIGYTLDDKYTIYVYGQNIFDEKYYTDSDASDGFVNVGLPQTFGAVLDIKF